MLKRLIGVPLLGLLLAMPAYADETESKVSTGFRIVPQWKEGDVFSFEAVKTQVKRSGGKLEAVKVKYAMEIRVVRVDAEGYLLAWSMSDFQMIEPPDPTGEAAKVGAGFGKDTPVRFRMTAAGALMGRIENWEQVSAGVLKDYDLVIASKEEKVRQKMHDSFAENLKNPAMRTLAETAMLTDAASMLILHGADFDVHAKPVAVTLPIPMKVTGELPAHQTNEIVKQDESQVVLRQTIECDPEAGKIMAKVLRESDKAAGGKSDVPEDGEIKMKTRKVYEGTIDRKRGIATALRISTSTEIEDGKDTLNQDIVIEIREKSVAASRPVK